MPAATERRGIFPGWWVVLASFIAIAALGEAFFSFGVFVKPLQDEFGWSRSLTSLAYTSFIVGYCISLVVGGRLGDRYRPRRLLPALSCVASLGIFMSGRVTGLGQLAFFLFLGGLGSGATFSVSVATVQRWFRRRKSAGTALAVVVSGAGVGQLLFTPLVNSFVVNYGWRDAYFIVGAIFFALTFPVTLFIKEAPAEPAVAPAVPGVQSHGRGWTTRQAAATRSYFSLVFAGCVGIFAYQTVTVHLVPHATDTGMSSAAAAGALGLLGGLTVPGRLASGLLAAALGWRRSLSLGLFGVGAAMVLVLFSTSVWMTYLFVVVLGIFSGIRIVSQIGLQTEYFGLMSAGELVGLTMAVTNLVGGAAPYVAGFIHDTTGSYVAAFVLDAVLALVAGLFVVLTKKPSGDTVAEVSPSP